MELESLLLYPTSWKVGLPLVFLYSFLVLSILWNVYQKKYTFSKKEKGITFILSVMFMVAGSLLISSPIPLYVWGLFAFHFAVDRKYMELPNGVNLVIAASAIIPIVSSWKMNGFLQSGLLTGIILFLFFWVLACLGPMGGGDIKMMGAIGLYFPLWDIPTLLFYGFLIGALQGIFLMFFFKQKKETVFAFGPALLLGTLATVVFKGGLYLG